MGDLASGRLTPEELAAKQQLSLDTAKGLFQALKDDPAGFGKNLGKSLLDWDTWADDPARALGHLVPDAVAAVFTGGTAAAATRGAKGLTDVVEALSRLGRHADDVGSLARHADDLGDLGDLGRHGDDLGDLGDLGRHGDDLGDPPSSMHEHDPADGYRSVEDQLRDPSYSPDNRDIIGDDYDVLGGRRSPEEFERDFRRDGDWNWPPHDGKVPGSETFPEPSDVPDLDRIGGNGGSYFADDGAPMADRSLPPDRLNFDRRHWSIDHENPDVASGAVRVERSDVAPWFGQHGGGVQYRFLDAEGNALSQGELIERGIIREGS